MKKTFVINTVLPANSNLSNDLPFDSTVHNIFGAWNAIRALRDWDQATTEELIGTCVTVQEEVMDDENDQSKTLLPPIINIIFKLNKAGKIEFRDIAKEEAKDAMRKKCEEAKAASRQAKQAGKVASVDETKKEM